jgi:DNA-binding beta-propeller fold protein YncE
MLDATTETLLRTTRVGQNPRAVAIDERTGRVFVVDEGPLSADRSGLPTANGTVSVLDATTGKLLRTTRVGVGASAAAVDVQTGRVFVANAGRTLSIDLHNPREHGSVSVLDATSGTLLSTVSTGAGTHALAVDEHNGRVLVSTGVVLDAHTGDVLHAVTPRGGPYDALAVDANVGHAVAVTSVDSPVPFYIVSALETGSGRIIRTLDVDTIQSGSAATVAVDTALHHAFAVTGGVVTVLDTRSVQVQHTVHLGPLVAVAVDAPLARVFVAQYNYALPTSHGILHVLDARSGRLLGRIALGVGPHALAVDAPSRHLFVANRGENTLSMLALTP